MNPVLKLAHSRRLVSSGEARRVRIAASVSLREMADAVGVSPTTIFRWERAQRSPHGEAAIRYADLIEQLGAGDAA